MRKTCYVRFSVPREQRDRIYSLLSRMECLDGWHESDPILPRSQPGLFHTFDETDPRLTALLDLLREEGIEWIENWDAEYSEDELLHSDFLTLLVGGRPIESGGPEFGTVYADSKGCARCGTGAVQMSPLMIAMAGLPKRGHICETCRGQVLVSEKLADAMRADGVSGVDLRQTLFYRNNEPLPWWQIIPTHTMPRMSRHTKGIVRDIRSGWGCPVCGRDMFANTMKEPTHITYDRHDADPSTLPDVVQTWECSGRSVLRDDPERQLIRGFAQPWILVKPRIMKLLRRLKVRGAVFEPVRFMD